jgi:hypothetical protein
MDMIRWGVRELARTHDLKCENNPDFYVRKDVSMGPEVSTEEPSRMLCLLPAGIITFDLGILPAFNACPVLIPDSCRGSSGANVKAGAMQTRALTPCNVTL